MRPIFRKTLWWVTTSTAVLPALAPLCARGEAVLPLSGETNPLVTPPNATVHDSGWLMSLQLSATSFRSTASFYYTTDGTAPDTSSQKYTSQIKVNRPTLFRVVAIHPILGRSQEIEIFVKAYTTNAIDQISTLADNELKRNHKAVTLSVPAENLDIYFTIDNTTPTENSTKYEGEPIIFTRSGTLKTFVVAREPGWVQSPVHTYYISVEETTPLFICGPEMDEPVHFGQGPSVPPLHYTLDRSTPTFNSPVWTAPLTLAPNTTIRVLYQFEGQPAKMLWYDLSDWKKISSAPVKVQKVGGEFSAPPADVALTPDGTVYTYSDGAVYRVEETSSERLFSYTGGVDALSVPTHNSFNFLRRSSTEFPESSIHTYSTVTGQLTERTASPIAFDLHATPDGNILHTSYTLRQIRRITPDNENLQYAGNGLYATPTEGPAIYSGFGRVYGITYESSSLATRSFYITDTTFRRILRITNIPGTPRTLSVMAGNNDRGETDGPVSSAQLNYPEYITSDRHGSIYFTDWVSHREGTVTRQGRVIRKLTPEGWISRLSGPLVTSDGSMVKADAFENEKFRGIEIDAEGKLYFASETGIYKLTQEDWDGDGIPDEDERLLGAPFVVGVDDRTADGDGDGFSNTAEWIAGTNPNDAAENPGAKSWVRVTEDSVYICLPATPGSQRQMEYSVDMKNWIPLGPVSTSSQKAHSVRYKKYPNTPTRFYRLKETR